MTWLKYSNRVGPIMVADNPTDQGNTPMGNSTHYMADWAPWEKRLIIENSLASGNIGGPLLYQRFTWDQIPFKDKLFLLEKLFSFDTMDTLWKLQCHLWCWREIKRT